MLDWLSVGLNFSVSELAERQRVREELEGRLAEFANLLREQGLVGRSVMRGGQPADEILNVVREEKADLIVMGTHGRRGLSRLLLGSVAEAVLRRAHCPVLAVKSPKFAQGHKRLVSAESRAES